MRDWDTYYDQAADVECLVDALLDMGAALIAVTIIAGVVLAVL